MNDPAAPSRRSTPLDPQDASPTAAGIVVVRAIDPALRYLLLRAYRNWDFPKGTIEHGETPLHAAVRETREETGLTELTFAWGERFIETERYGRGKIARFYVAEAPHGTVELPISPTLGRPEHHQFEWFRYDEAHAVLVPRLQRVLEWAAEVVASDRDAAR